MRTPAAATAFALIAIVAHAEPAPPAPPPHRSEAKFLVAPQGGAFEVALHDPGAQGTTGTGCMPGMQFLSGSCQLNDQA